MKYTLRVRRAYVELDTLDANAEKIEDDLDAMIVEKAGQLGRVMRDRDREILA